MIVSWPSIGDRECQLLSLAQTELDDAVDWYNEQAPGLGIEFLDELDVMRRIIPIRDCERFC